jgi:hypothetical protein
MTYDTLSYNGTEKEFADWGFGLEGVVSVRNVLRADTFDATDFTADPTADPAFAFEGAVAVYAGRTSSTGAANSFSGGVCKFQGKRVIAPSIATVRRPGLHYHFENAWYDLEKTQFLQPYLGVAGNFDPGETVLFTSTQNAAGNLYVPISLGDQLQAGLQWLLDQYAAQGMAAPFQYTGRALNGAGHIDLTRTGTLGGGFTYTYAVSGSSTIDAALYRLYLPSYVAKPMTVADLLIKCLELSPRTNIAFDYSTSPPKLHAQSVDNLPAVTLPFADGTSMKSLTLRRRDDLAARAVVITYRITNTVSGAKVIDYATDKWGPNGANSASDPSTGLRVLADTVDLQGYSVTTVSGHLDCEPLACSGGTTAAKRAWWSSRRGGEQARLIDSRVRFQTLTYTVSGTGAAQTRKVTGATAATIPDAVLTYATAGFDSTGAAVAAGQPLTSADLAFYTNRLVRGTHHAWMQTSGGVPVKTVKVRCTAAKVQYVIWDKVTSGDTAGALPASETTTDADYTDGNVVKNHQAGHDLHCELELTNGSTGVYSTISSYSDGEAYVIGAGGIAQYLFNTLNALQYEGDYVKVAASFGAGVSPINCLNLTGGRLEWAAMNAQVQSVRETWGRYTTEVRIGPARHLSAAQLSSLLNAWRYRRLWYNPLLRTDNSLVENGASVEMPVTAGSANSVDGVPAPAHTTVVDHSTPGDPTSAPNAIIEVSAPIVTQINNAASPTPVDGSTTNEAWRVQPRELAVPTTPGANQQFAIVLAGGPYTKSGGGTAPGGGPVLCTYVKAYGNYWLCSLGGAHLRVAKPAPIRASIASETILGQTFSYSYGIASGFDPSLTRSSTRSSDGFVENQALDPFPTAGWQMLAQGGLSTGLTCESQDVTDNPGDGITTSTPVTYLDTGNWGCAWYAPNDQTVSDW